MKGGFIGPGPRLSPRSPNKDIIEKAPDTPPKSLASREDIMEPRFGVDEPSRVEDGTQSPSPYIPARLVRRVDILTLWNQLDAKGRTISNAIQAEHFRQPRRNKHGCINPTIWDLRTTPSVDPLPELQAIILRINNYYTQFRGPQVPYAPGSWPFYSATYPRNVNSPPFYLNSLLSTQARAIAILTVRTVIRASDPNSVVIPPGSTDLQYAPNDLSDLQFALWKAKCTNEGVSPSILQWVLFQDVVESNAVQVMEYMFRSSGWYAANGTPNLLVLARDQAGFYVLTATPILIGMSRMLENYALDLGGYVLGVGFTWEPIPPDPLHPTGRRYYMWLQIFHV